MSTSHQQTCFIVLGMHRSGTSVLTGVLSHAGISLGKNLLGAAKDNPKGFHENAEILRINEEFLQTISSSWDDILLDRKVVESAVTDEYVQKAVQCLQSEFGDTPCFAIKDPRNCLLFPLWERAMQELGINIQIIIPLRNPLEVIQSLQKRNGFTDEKGYALWANHILHSEIYSRNYQRIWISFDDMVGNPATVEKLLQFCTLGYDKQNNEEIHSFIDTTLKHHAMVYPVSDDNAPVFVNKINTLLENKEYENSEEWDLAMAEYSIYRSFFQPVELSNEIQNGKKALFTVNLQNQELQDQRIALEKKDAEISAQLGKLQDQRIALEKRDMEIQHQSTALRKKQDQLQMIRNERDLGVKELAAIEKERTRLHHILHERTEKLHSVSGQLQTIHQSKEWKLIQQYHHIKNRIVPIGSIQRTGLKIVARFITSVKRKATTVRNIMRIATCKKLFFLLRTGQFRYLCREIYNTITALFGASGNTHIEDQRVPLQTAMTLLQKSPSYFSFSVEEAIDIVIPVYNGMEFLPPLFQSIVSNTVLPYRLLVVNDKSPDPTVIQFLKEFQQNHPDVNMVLIENQENLGFVQTVNIAVKHVQNHFVILNTDTEVPYEWLTRLMFPIYKMEKIASTTPFTNAATIFSFPHWLQDNDIFEELSVEELDQYFRYIDIQKNYLEVPTGVGFCMGINKDLVDEIGMFDADSFGKGYGEENDWCMRAIEAGYKNILVPNLFVYHKHGGSFASEEKQQLIEHNMKVLERKHPTYHNEVQKLISANPMRLLREALILFILSNADKQNMPMLIIDHELGGGANAYRDTMIKERISDGKKTLLLTYNMHYKQYGIRFFYKEFNIFFIFDTLSEINTYAPFIQFNEIFVNELVSFPDIVQTVDYICELAAQRNTIVTVPIHDFFMICPSYQLLNDKDVYCNVPKNINTCVSCIANNKREFRNYVKEEIDIHAWRNAWQSLLEMANSIICFSDSSKNILLRAYSTLDRKKIQIVPHQVNDITPITSLRQKNKEEPFIIGVLGAINYSKGLDIIKNLAKEIEETNSNTRIVIIGVTSEQIYSPAVSITGRYKKENLAALVEQYAIDVFFIPSVWPETFSYTTEEVIQMNMPIAVFDIGAPAERVKNYNKGILLPYEL